VNPARILIAGVGNIFLGDDAFGVEVTQRLLRRAWPGDIRVVDFGIRGLDLVYALLDGPETVILIDAVPRGDGPPGTLYVLEPQLNDAEAAPLIEAHSMDPVKVLQTAAAMGAKLQRILLVGCEPTPMTSSEDEAMMEMSAPARAAVEHARVVVAWAGDSPISADRTDVICTSCRLR
jgi:hydrogenase maturation protease